MDGSTAQGRAGGQRGFEPARKQLTWPALKNSSKRSIRWTKRKLLSDAGLKRSSCKAARLAATTAPGLRPPLAG
jgi:hypothetical protein